MWREILRRRWNPRNRDFRMIQNLKSNNGIKQVKQTNKQAVEEKSVSTHEDYSSLIQFNKRNETHN